jgi:uncharacterized protein YcgL (UPF0745 family)
MKVKVFESIKNRKRYVFVREDVSIENLPEEIRNEIGVSQPFKSIDLNEKDEHLIALDPQKAIKSINSNGYYVQGVEIKSKITIA